MTSEWLWLGYSNNYAEVIERQGFIGIVIPIHGETHSNIVCLLMSPLISVQIWNPNDLAAHYAVCMHTMFDGICESFDRINLFKFTWEPNNGAVTVGGVFVVVDVVCVFCVCCIWITIFSFELPLLECIEKWHIFWLFYVQSQLYIPHIPANR